MTPAEIFAASAKRKAAKIVPPHVGQKEKFTLVCDCGVGDTCAATSAIESLERQYPQRFEIGIVGNAMDLLATNPHISRFPAEQGKRCTLGVDGAQHNFDGKHMIQAICDSIGNAIGLPLEMKINQPKFYLTKDERAERLVPEPYCLINAGYRHDITVKWYSRWQEVVDLVKEVYPWLTIVQVGNSDDIHPPLDGVVSMVGKWNGQARKLVIAANNAEFGMGPISFIHHAFAGVSKPYVCVLTGDEPRSWGHYSTARYVSRHGTLPCCKRGGCWVRTMRKCVRPINQTVPACLDIPPEEVVAEIQKLDEFIARPMPPNLPNARITVGTLYTSNMANVGRKCETALRRYALANGYGVRVGYEAFDNRPPSWSKIKLALNHFQEYPDCEWFFWIDADAFIVNDTIKLESMLDDMDFICGDDQIKEHGSPFNMGAWLVRNTPKGREFLEAIWNSANDPNGKWWEQGEAHDLILNNRIPGLRAKIVPRKQLGFAFFGEYQHGDFLVHYTAGDVAAAKQALNIHPQGLNRLPHPNLLKMVSACSSRGRDRKNNDGNEWKPECGCSDFRTCDVLYKGKRLVNLTDCLECQRAKVMI